MAVNNLDIIKSILKWDNDDLFYFIQILQRKKDHGVGQISGCNNNSRMIKAYFVCSQERLDFYMDEIIKLCDLFGARAGINLNRRSYTRIQLQHIKKVTDQLINGDSTRAHKAYSSVCGKYSSEGKNKRWILDIDVEKIDDNWRTNLESFLYHLRPDDGYGNALSKVIKWIPSKSGWHLITRPFDVQAFKKAYPEIEIKKDNPTNLYCPG